MKLRFLVLAAAVVTALVVLDVRAFAQKGTATPPPASAPSKPSTGLNTPNTNNTNLPGSRQQTGLPGLQSGIYVTGKVVTQDGSELPINVMIEKVCGTRTTGLGYTDRKGGFSVTLSGPGNLVGMTSVIDASEDSRPRDGAPYAMGRTNSSNNLMGCEIRASYPGYRSEAINIGSQRVMDNPNIGTIVLRHMGPSNAQGTTVSATMLNAPKNAIKAYEHGMDAVRKGNTTKAEEEFEKAVAAHPTFANAWYELGHLQITGNAVEAKQSFAKAVAADPKYVLPYLDLATLASHEAKWDDLVALTDRGIRLDGSSFPQLYFYNAAGNYYLKHFDEADKKVREAIKLDVDHRFGKSEQLLGYILAAKGDLQGATEHMQAYLTANPGAPDAAATRTQITQMQARLTPKEK